MIVTTRVSSLAELMSFLDGKVITTGTEGSNSAASTTFTDSSVNFTTLGAAIGDSLHIFGVGIFRITAVGSTTLTLGTPIGPSTASQGYRVLQDSVGTSQLYDLHSTADGGFTILYDPFAPASSKGFMANTGEVTAIPNGSYSLAKKVELNWTGSLADRNASEPHDQIKISHLELHFDNAASVTGVEFAITWDAEGDKVALGPTGAAITPFTGLTNASPGNHRSVSASFGEQVIDFRNSSAVSGKKLYLHIKLTGGTGDLQTARLYWFV